MRSRIFVSMLRSFYKGLESTSFYYAGTSHWASEYLERRMSDKSTLLNFEFSTVLWVGGLGMYFAYIYT
eukprot:297241-Amorphochlora_amoeboformis.AAC.2